jgi:CheY-like chemotaxis protein
MSYLNAALINSGHKRKFHCGNWSAFVSNPKPSIAGKRCLVLDDEFLIALDIQQILEAAGAGEVTCFSTSSDCLTALQAGKKFDLAILDFKLGDGARNSHSVAALLHRQGTPFVFVTGMGSQDVRSKEFPDAPLVEKPYQAPLLLDAIQRALAAR